MTWLRLLTGSGLITIVTISMMSWVIWSMGVTGGAAAAMNDSQSITEYHEKIEMAETNATQALQENDTGEYNIMLGVTSMDLVKGMIDIAHRGADYGYENPRVGHIVGTIAEPVAWVQVLSLLGILGSRARDVF